MYDLWVSKRPFIDYFLTFSCFKRPSFYITYIFPSSEFYFDSHSEIIRYNRDRDHKRPSLFTMLRRSWFRPYSTWSNDDRARSDFYNEIGMLFDSIAKEDFTVGCYVDLDGTFIIIDKWSGIVYYKEFILYKFFFKFLYL
jgi:hypothetical protein